MQTALSMLAVAIAALATTWPAYAASDRLDKLCLLEAAEALPKIQNLSISYMNVEPHDKNLVADALVRDIRNGDQAIETMINFHFYSDSLLKKLRTAHHTQFEELLLKPIEENLVLARRIEIGIKVGPLSAEYQTLCAGTKAGKARIIKPYLVK